MTGIGVLLIVLGVGSLLLPMFDLQFRLMEFVDPYQPWAGLVVGIIGAVLVGMGLQRSRAAATTPAVPAAAPPAAATPALSVQAEPAALPAERTIHAAPATESATTETARPAETSAPGDPVSPEPPRTDDRPG